MFSGVLCVYACLIISFTLDVSLEARHEKKEKRKYILSIHYICRNGKYVSIAHRVSDTECIIEPCDQCGPGSPYRQDSWWGQSEENCKRCWEKCTYGSHEMAVKERKVYLSLWIYEQTHEPKWLSFGPHRKLPVKQWAMPSLVPPV